MQQRPNTVSGLSFTLLKQRWSKLRGGTKLAIVLGLCAVGATVASQFACGSSCCAAQAAESDCPYSHAE